MGEIFGSPFEDIEIADVPVHQHVLGRARERGDRIAVVDGATGRAMTYGELAEEVEAVAAGLVAHGFQPGDVVALVAPNCPEYVIAFHATSMAGGTVTPVNPSYGVAEIAYQLRDSGAGMVFAAEGVVEA